MNNSDGHRELEWLAREYETLRQESLASMGHMLQVISLGLAAFGFLSGGASLAAESAPAVTVGILGFGIPFLVVFVLFIWLGEMNRMVRAGTYIARIESRVNERLERDVLGWETWLRLEHQMRFPYERTIDLVLAVAAPFPLLALDFADLAWWPWGCLVAIPIGILFGARWARRRFLRRLKKWSQEPL